MMSFVGFGLAKIVLVADFVIANYLFAVMRMLCC